MDKHWTKLKNRVQICYQMIRKMVITNPLVLKEHLRNQDLKATMILKQNQSIYQEAIKH